MGTNGQTPISAQTPELNSLSIRPADCETSLNDTDVNADDLYPGVTEFRHRFTSNFILTHVNINSIRHKFASIHDILAKKHVDYLAISESKLDDSFPNAQFAAQDYSIFRQDLTSSSGGLLIYMRADLPHRRLQNAEVNADGFESLCMEVTIGKTKTAIICVYKHPTLKNDIFKRHVYTVADVLLRTHEDLVFIGDMNCCPTKSSTIQDICETYGLTNLIKEPTCCKAKVPTVLDVILVTNPSRYLGILNSEFCTSDFHNIIGAVTRRFAPSQKPHKILYRSYKYFNDSAFSFDVQAAPFHVMEIFDDADDMAWYTSTLLGDVIDAHAPMKAKVVKRQSVPYMNSKLRKCIYSRNMARNKFRKFGQKHWEENRRQRNRLVALRKKSIANYFEKNCQKQDKTFWKTISPFLSDKKFRNGNNIILREDNDTVVDTQQITEIFNGYFSSIASTIGFCDVHATADDAIAAHKDHPSVVKIRNSYEHIDANFSFRPVTPHDIQRKLKLLNTRKATGYDNIPAKLLRLAQSELAGPVTNLINTTMAMNTFPDHMKCAEVSPIFKKEDNLNKKNFRPVSVLTGISKLYESVVNDQLLEFFSNIFNDLVSAFRKGHICQSLCLNVSTIGRLH